MRPPLARVVRAAAGAVTGLALTSTLLVAAPASAAPAPADRAGGWLARQLTGGLVINDTYGGFEDYGLTGDLVLGLDALDTRPKKVRQARRALAANVDAWTTGGDFAPDDVYAGSVAKAAVVAQAVGADPRKFGGVDLVARLEERVSTADGLTGRIQDRSAQDYANVIGQAYAVRALGTAGSDLADEALGFLLQQQCEGGHFRLYFNPADAADQSCDGADEAGGAPDTDVTAIAVLALQALPREQRTAEVRAAVNAARKWLRRSQRANGSLGGGPATEKPNANSTGLAAWALGSTGACKPARAAARWVKKLQVPVKPGKRLKGQAGAIAYDRAAFRAAKADGITVEAQDQWRRTTVQAAPGLRYLSLRACR